MHVQLDFLPKKEKHIINEDRESLGFLVNRAGRMMENVLRDKMVNAGIEMPHEQWVILFLLWQRDGRNQNDLARNICKDKGTITRGLDSLERYNFVVRVQDEQDKRHKRVYLTHKGKEMQAKLIPLGEATTELAIEGIGENELAICKKVLRNIFENLEKI